MAPAARRPRARSSRPRCARRDRNTTLPDPSYAWGMASAPLCILVAGDPVPKTQERAGGFANLVRAGLEGAWDGAFVEVDVRSAESLPAPERFAGLIVTGSASSVTERVPWMLRIEQY